MISVSRARLKPRASCANVGGCSFAARPDRSAAEQPVYWAPEVDPGIINLIELPVSLRAEPKIAAEIPYPQGELDEIGLHIRPSPEDPQLAFLNGAQPDKPLAAVIPLDDMAFDRLSSIEQFIHSVSGKYRPDARLTPAQRRRLVHMLRCIDGQEQQASHFEVATALFGRRLVIREDWHDSSFRYQMHRLARDGAKMVERGYRQLLRFRRRRP